MRFARARVATSALLLAFVSQLVACGGRPELARTVTPRQAREQGLAPLAVVRSTTRIPLGVGARVEADRVVLRHTLRVGDGDVVEEDAQHRIVALRRASGTRIAFRPGSAEASEDLGRVSGELAGPEGSLELLRHDRIEVEPLPLVAGDERAAGEPATSESRRPTGLLVGGATVLLLAYAPTAYFGAASPRTSDRNLLLPVAGPFLNATSRPDCVPPKDAALLPVDPCIEERATRAGLYASGAVQSLGALLLLLWLPPRNAPVPTGADRPRRSATLVVAPTTTGAAAFGTF